MPHLCQHIFAMKRLLFLLLLVPVIGWSQKKHTVGPKETLFSIGRLYKVHPRELAEFNNIPYGSGLNVGQVLNIPAKRTMEPLPPVTADPTDPPVVKTVVKTEVKKADPVALQPVYHKVQKKETLYQVSRLYNKVPIDDLKKWNHLASDGLSEGMNLIVGYTAAGTVPVKTIAVEPKPVIEKPNEIVVEKKPEPVPQKSTPTQTETVKAPVTNIDINFKGGVFKTLYDSQVKGSEVLKEEGTAGVFKSTSGWNDGKYYCLHNSAAPGTIIKISNKTTGRSVYAKVLDIIPDLKQNTGLLIRISNAASAELGAGENNFECELSYSK
jgi:LysM repeat protein